PTGTGLVFSTYYGGTGSEDVEGVAIDGAGNITIAGATGSTDLVLVGAIQPTNAGGNDVFYATLDPTGTTLLGSTYFGGSGSDSAWGVTVDANGAVYLAGMSASTNFPVTVGSAPGANNGFVVKIGTTHLSF